MSLCNHWIQEEETVHTWSGLVTQSVSQLKCSLSRGFSLSIMYSSPVQRGGFWPRKRLLTMGAIGGRAHLSTLPNCVALQTVATVQLHGNTKAILDHGSRTLLLPPKLLKLFPKWLSTILWHNFFWEGAAQHYCSDSCLYNWIQLFAQWWNCTNIVILWLCIVQIVQIVHIVQIVQIMQAVQIPSRSPT